MRQISMRDLKLADSLSHMSELEMLSPENEAALKEVLAEIGFNVQQPINFIPCLHRDMKQHAAVGFLVTGEYNVDRKYNKFIDTTDRVVIVGMQDPSLAKDMLEIMGKKFSYKNEDETENKTRENDARYYTPEQLAELGYTGMEQDDEDYSEGAVDSDYDMITSQIMALEAIKKSLRG